MKIRNIFLIVVLLLIANSANADVPVTGVTLNKATLTLNKDTAETLIATVNPFDATNKAITWASNNTAVATVNSYGLVTAVGDGICGITATTVDGEYVAWCVVTVPSIPVTGISLNKSITNLNVGDSETLIATISPIDATNQAVTWTSNNATVATVNSSGLVTALSEGTCTISATTIDGGFTAACQVTVSIVAVTKVTLDRTSLQLGIDNPRQFTAYVYPSNATNKAVIWTSSNTSVATVNSSGYVTPVSLGYCNITATTVDGGFTATCFVDIYTPVNGVTLNKTTLTLGKGTNETLIATISPSNANYKSVSWSSSSSVASVSPSGKVTGVSVGTCTITVLTNDRNYSAHCHVTVVPIPVTGITLNKTTLTLNKTFSQTLAATISPSNATNKNLTWTSSDTSVATVNSSGYVTAIDVGTSTITVTTADGGFTATCQVTVIYTPVTGITLQYTTYPISIGGEFHISETINPSNASIRNVTWSSSNTSVATVNSSGWVTGKNPGICTITATTVDGGFTATCQVTVPIPVTGVSLNKTTLTLNRGNSETLEATISPSDAGNKSVTWSSSNPSVATVSSAGLVTSVGLGNCTITVTTYDHGFTATCLVNVIIVQVSGITLNKTNLTLNKSTSDTLAATISPSDAANKAVIWSSSDNSIAIVDKYGEVTAVEEGNCVITATTIDGGFTAMCNIIVKPIAIDIISEYATTGWAYDTAIKDNYACLADGNGFIMFDTSNPSSPVKVGEIATAGDMCSVDVSGDYAYLASWGTGLEIIDISDPANPQKVGGYTTTGKACAVAVSGDFAYVADSEVGLEIFDISDPANPARVGGYYNNGFVHAVAVSDGYAYITDFTSGLIIIDISDPANPQKVSEYNTFGVASNIAVSGNYVYIADSESGLLIIDVTNPVSPVQIGGFNYYGYAYDISIVGKYAYIVDFDTGLVILDISDPTNPQMIARFSTTGNGNNASQVGNYIYMAEGDAGLGVIGVGHQVTGKVLLESYYGDLTNVGVMFGLVEDGSQLWNTPINLDGSGNFTVPYILPGIHDLSIKGSHWLRRVVSDVAIAENTIIADLTLINGDVVDNNEVDYSDINATRAAYGSFPGDGTWNAMADVDGSGEVDYTDINIVRSKYGEVGE